MSPFLGDVMRIIMSSLLLADRGVDLLPALAKILGREIGRKADAEIALDGR